MLVFADAAGIAKSPADGGRPVYFFPTDTRISFPATVSAICGAYCSGDAAAKLTVGETYWPAESPFGTCQTQDFSFIASLPWSSYRLNVNLDVAHTLKSSDKVGLAQIRLSGWSVTTPSPVPGQRLPSPLPGVPTSPQRRKPRSTAWALEAQNTVTHYNPGLDEDFQPAWEYGYLSAMSAVAPPHSQLPSSPNVFTRLIWDPAWLDGTETWARQDNQYPAISARRMILGLSASTLTMSPTIRWRSPFNSRIEASVSGTVLAGWSFPSAVASDTIGAVTVGVFRQPSGVYEPLHTATILTSGGNPLSGQQAIRLATRTWLDPDDAVVVTLSGSVASEGGQLWAEDSLSYEVEGLQNTAANDPPSRHLIRVVSANPFSNTVQLQVPAHAFEALVIYDISGRHLRRFSLAGGQSLVTWDGHDGEGRAVAPGIYYCQGVGGWKSPALLLIKSGN